VSTPGVFRPTGDEKVQYDSFNACNNVLQSTPLEDSVYTQQELSSSLDCSSESLFHELLPYPLSLIVSWNLCVVIFSS
jgi:hypothetical protein